MDRRVLFHSHLKLIVDNVYFQPPTDGQMAFPCIVYKRAKGDSRFADNSLYLNHKRYTVTVIDEDPDSPIPDAVAALPMSTFSTFYVADNLNHDVFDIFF